MTLDVCEDFAELTEGTRVVLVRWQEATVDDHESVPSGTLGTVTGHGYEQLWVKWDNGSMLSPVYGDEVARFEGELFCPKCGNSDVASADHVQATAFGAWVVQRSDADEDVRIFEAAGESEVHWDSQEPDEDAPCFCRQCTWEGKPEELATVPPVEA